MTNIVAQTRSYRQRPYTLAIDKRLIPRMGLSKDDAIYWKERTLELNPCTEVAIVRDGRRVEVSHG